MKRDSMEKEGGETDVTDDVEAFERGSVDTPPEH